ncbi:MAG: hypothetical protein WDO18_21315 [Acidobacteriota bacterium]
MLAWKNPAGAGIGAFADKVIGQRDFLSAFAGGPGAQPPVLSAAGMTLPAAVAVDSTGNLYVMDSGNNRILRFPKPLEQTAEFVSPDLVIGQKTANSGRSANQGQPKPTERTLSLLNGTTAGGSLIFDSNGNLWVADTFNHRVLRFPKAALTGSEPQADLVLGQPAFTTNDPANSGLDFDHRKALDGLYQPTTVAVDSQGAVYVGDGLLRVVYYASPATGGLASRVLGIQPLVAQGTPVALPPTEFTLGQFATSATTYIPLPPQCIFTAGTVVFVCDAIAHRIVRYNSPDQWPAATVSAPSPPAVAVYGQDSLTAGVANRGAGASKPNGNTFNLPSGAAFLGSDLWVADAGNNRVVALPVAAGTFNVGTASRVLGQATFDTNAPNLVEAKNCSSTTAAATMAVRSRWIRR